MAQLKDTIVTGDLSVTGTIYGDVPVDDLSGYTGTTGFLKKENDSWSLSAVTIPDATSVKGNAETTYRTGQVNLTPANLGISATTTSVTVGSTTFNKYTHPTGAGNNHIPSGGSSGQFLGWSSAGTAAWVANPNTDTKVTQAAAITTAGDYPVLLGYSTATTAVTNTVNKTSTLIYNPSTKELTTNGTITLGNGTTAILNAKTPSRSSSFLIVGGGKNTVGNADGTAVRLGAGGLTLVGGGEYASNRYNVADLSDRTEQLYLGADGAVFIETNAQTTTDRNTFNFTTAGNLEVAKPNTTETKLEVSNTNGALSLNVSTNRGIWDTTGNSWMVYRAPGMGQPTKVPSHAAEDTAVRNIGYGTEEPTGGNDGDVYIQYSDQAGSLSSIIDIIYPVGSIYMNVQNINPAILFGGTWERLPGRFLLGWQSDWTIGEEGGSATFKHTHTEGNLAAAVGASGNNIYALSYQAGSLNSRGPSTTGQYTLGASSSTSSAYTYNHHTRVYGTTSETSITNWPPYLIVSMWKRVS